MRRFALVGHPVAHSVSPAMHEAALRALGLPGRYDLLDAPDAAALGRAVARVRDGTLAGANVTVPHKRAVLGEVDWTGESAREAGAANTLVRLPDGRVAAYDTDVAGLEDDLRALGAAPRTAAVIGDGGAAAAAVLACRNLGATVVAVTARSWSTTEALAASPTADAMRRMGALPGVWPVAEAGKPSSLASGALRMTWPGLAALADVVVQATSAGMAGAEAAGGAVAAIVPWERLRRDAIAYDVVYRPAETPFLRSARSRGLRASGGLGMLVRQGARSIALWLGVSPDLDIMRRAAQDALEGR